MRETLHKVNEILDGRNVSWLIDPESFRRYGVSQVPAFVLAHGPGQGTCPKSVPAGDYVMVAGDVSLDYAMEMIGRSSDVWRPMAMHIADEVRGGRQ
jgi:type-F conjugative transfer system pilin assembly protein TrbC